MPLIQEINEEEAGPSRAGPSLVTVLKELAARLALPEELLASFVGGDIRECDQGVQELTRTAQEAMDIYQSHASSTMEQIERKIAGSGWDMMDLEEQGDIMDTVTKLYGVDPFTSADIRERIDRESANICRLADGRYQHPHR
jgi:hypothetical protein